jgi:hypothetical protein
MDLQETGVITFEVKGIIAWFVVLLHQHATLDHEMRTSQKRFGFL